MNQFNDEQLLSQIKTGNRSAFRELTERYLHKVWRISFNVLQNNQDAEDVAQEVLISVWNYRDKWIAGEATFSTWLYRVTINKAIDHKRQRKITCELNDEWSDGKKGADDVFADKQLRKTFLLCMDSIPAKQRQCLFMFYYEELNIEEICQKLVTTQDSVRSLLKRGKVSMKDALSVHHHGGVNTVGLIAAS